MVIQNVPALGNVRDILQELFPDESLRCLVNVMERRRWFQEPEQLRTYYWFDLNNREVAYWQEWALQALHCWPDKTRRVWSPEWMNTLQTTMEHWSIIAGFEPLIEYAKH